MSKEREALKLAIARLEWFVDAYPHDIAVSKEEFFRPFNEAVAQPEQWGASAITRPEYVSEQKRKTEELRSMLIQPEQKPDYAYPTIKDYEEIVGFEVGDAFKMGWTMARTTNAFIDQLVKGKS